MVTTGSTTEGFNAADYLVSRHVAAGDGERTAVLASETLTYAELDERVGIVAGGLRALGLRRDDRVLLVMSDEIPMLTGILGAFRAGLVAVPVSTMFTGSELGKIMDDSGARAVLATPEFAEAVSQAVALSPDVEHVVLAGEGDARGRWRRTPAHLGRADRRGRAGRPVDRADPRRLVGALALHLRHDRAAQGRHAPARQHPPRLRDVRRPGARHHARRHDLLGGEDVLRLRHREHGVLPALRGREDRARAAAAQPRRRTRTSRPGPAHPVLRGADLLRRAHRQRPARRRVLTGAAVRVGRRTVARPAAEAVHRPVRRGDPGRHRLHGGAAHLPVQPARGHPARHHRSGRPGLRPRDPRHRRKSRCGRRAGCAVRPGRVDRARLLAPHRRHARRLPG